ncbi:hypothetical protein Salat_0549600 [Sesamum alatum]|uniref:Pectinesterase inhibitor domain-containing protein n=1 Tax=Sesamum alatum TaxID=300844 RepID=A0AAE1YPI8_9LAMI|nr:hypothetical protein Salat_0549600 [Sesamum alatum]
MEPNNNLRLLFILLCLALAVVSLNATPLSPEPAPSSSEQTFSYEKFFPSSPTSESGESAAQQKEEPSDAGSSSKQQKAPADAGLSADLHSVGAPPTGNLGVLSKIPAVNANPEVKKICDSTDHPDLCLTTVVPLLNGKTSVESVLEVSVKASDEFAKNALAMVKQEAKKPGASPKMISTLKDCKDGYDTAVENFEKTMNAFSSHDLGTMRSMLSAVITFVGDCEDGFAEMKEHSPLSSYAKQLTNMTSNCLAISSLMMN